MTLATKDLILSGKTQPTFSERKRLISLQKLIETKIYWLELRFFGKELIIFQQLFLFYSLIFPPTSSRPKFQIICLKFDKLQLLFHLLQ